eukprot:15013402-Alexandrium_andersonii.AAC.1
MAQRRRRKGTAEQGQSTRHAAMHGLNQTLHSFGEACGRRRRGRRTRRDVRGQEGWEQRGRNVQAQTPPSR